VNEHYDEDRVLAFFERILDPLSRAAGNALAPGRWRLAKRMYLHEPGGEVG
jgi:hypothetical protein